MKKLLAIIVIVAGLSVGIHYSLGDPVAGFCTYYFVPCPAGDGSTCGYLPDGNFERYYGNDGWAFVKSDLDWEVATDTHHPALCGFGIIYAPPGDCDHPHTGSFVATDDFPADGSPDRAETYSNICGGTGDNI